MRPELPPALRRLREDLAAVRLELELPEAARARSARDDIVGQTDDYLLPRLEQMEAPVLIVVGGSTGAGKSTIVNSLVDTDVSPAGVLRPTTRGPVLVCHPDDVSWFADDRILPDLPRATGGSPAPGTLLLTPVPEVPAGLALLDSPDIDSVLAENRALANQLLAAADAWLFVTTAARYADAVPWELLLTARERGTALALVLNRVPHDAEREVTAHLQEMMRTQRLDAVLLVVGETELDGGRLPSRELAPVRRWLDGLAADAEARADLIRRTLTGALRSLPGRAGAVERAAAEQLAAAADLRSEADLAYASARQEIEDALRSGSLLRGEVVARWHEVVGTGDLCASCSHASRSSGTGSPPRSPDGTSPRTSSARRSSIGSRPSSVQPPSGPRNGPRTPGASGRPDGRSWMVRRASRVPPTSSVPPRASRYARGRDTSWSLSVRRARRSARRRALRHSASTARASP